MASVGDGISALPSKQVPVASTDNGLFWEAKVSRTVKSGPPPDPLPKAPPPQPLRWQEWLVLVLSILVIAVLIILTSLWSRSATPLSYTDFLAKVDGDQVVSVTIDDRGSVFGTFRDKSTFTSQIPTALNNAGLESRLAAKNVRITAEKSSTDWGGALLVFLPVLLLIGFFLWSGRQAQRSLGGGVLGFGRSKTKIIEEQRPTTRFADVAGYEGVKQEVSEIVDFLRDPAKYAAAGAKGPRGVIMVGPPGTGKTLLGRAVAGEASVPFLSVTGSTFVEMFVGVGASRVRDLFNQARQRAPAIIFIDEIDAVGSRR